MNAYRLKNPCSLYMVKLKSQINVQAEHQQYTIKVPSIMGIAD